MNTVLQNSATACSEEVCAEVGERFKYKAWNEDQVTRGSRVSDAAVVFAAVVVGNAPPSSSRTRALNLIEEARMLANVAITHNGKF